MKPNFFLHAPRFSPWTWRQTVTFAFALIVVRCALSESTAWCDDRLNVVVLYADDWRHDTLGCAGHPIVKTPNIDRLASNGVRFKNNYVTTSICGVSRATLLTGQWMSRHGNFAFNRFKTPWEETYPGLLRSQGYYVGHIGKWHNGPFPSEKYDVGKSYADTHWHRDELGKEIHVTQMNERDAIQFLKERPGDRPFCLTLSFFATHAEDSNPKQYLPQPESMKLYADDVVPSPANGSDEDFMKLPKFLAQNKNEGRIRWRWRFDTPDRYQEYMKNYFRLVSEVDSACGAVLAELRRQNLLDKTLVIFTTDNGYFHGEHGLADKWYPYEESIRVPLVIDDPRMNVSVRGTVNEHLTLNVDLAPTIVSAASIQPPDRMQGRDLSSLYRNPQAILNWRTEFFYEHATISNIERIPSSQALVRKNIKYMFWPDYNAEQLFDLERDPHENHDVVAEASYSKRLQEMRERFSQLRELAK